jgi:hypothetical protein
MYDRGIAAPPLLPKEIKKQDDGLILGFKMVAHHLSTRSNTSPTTRQASLSEEGWFNRHRIKASHISRNVGSLNIKAVRLNDHAGMILSLGLAVQREF